MKDTEKEQPKDGDAARSPLTKAEWWALQSPADREFLRELQRTFNAEFVEGWK